MSNRIRKLGIVHSLVKSGYAVIKLEDKNIRTGVKALWKGREIGIISDIIGNIKAPYALVRLADRNLMSEMRAGDEVYYEYQPPKKRGRGRRRGKRNEIRSRMGRLPRRVLSNRGRDSMQKHRRSRKR